MSILFRRTQAIALSRSVVLVVLSLFMMIHVVAAQDSFVDTEAASSPPLSDACEEVRYLMGNHITPYDANISGDVLEVGIPIEEELTNEDFARVYTVAAVIPEEQETATITLDIEADLNLEVAVFRGLDADFDEATVGFQPVSQGISTLTYTISDEDIYTIFVRRPRMYQEDNVGRYSLTADYSVATGEQEAPTIGDDGGIFEDGIIEFTEVGGARLAIHANAVSSRPTTSISYDGGSLGFNISGNSIFQPASIFMLGGDLAVWESDSRSERRILYVQGYPHRASGQFLTGSKTVFNGLLDVDWASVSGVWMVDSCVGLKYHVDEELRQEILSIDDDMQFITPLPADARNVSFVPTRNQEGQFCSAFDNNNTFDIAFDILDSNIDDADPETITISLCRDWLGVQPGSEMLYLDGVLEANLVSDRHLTLQSKTIELYGRRIYENFDARECFEESDFSDVPFFDSGLCLVWMDINFVRVDGEDETDVAIDTDWLNIGALSIIEQANAPELPQQITIEFLDDTRTETTRTGSVDQTDIATLEAFNDVIQIVYLPPEGVEEGEERLLLPADESYVEIVTPSGPINFGDGQPFSSNALPGEPGYVPRGMNNTGGDCLPNAVNLLDAPCTRNGYPNSMNGNLWYAVTDHSAESYLLPLTLTRSYNSAYAEIEGPFGKGWSTEFIADYDVPFDDKTQSRLVTPEDVERNRVALDVTLAPRGIVTYTTPSGTRHVFREVNNSSIEDGEKFVSATMAGWFLERGLSNSNNNFQRNLRDIWTLYGGDGQQITFDRAGRLLRSGYDFRGNEASITYLGVSRLDSIFRYENILNGPGRYGQDAPVLVVDGIAGRGAQRAIALFFDENGRIEQSQLRGLTDPNLQNNLINSNICEVTQTELCLKAEYNYTDEGLLQDVNFEYGPDIRYAYDAAGRLACVDDPYSPISRFMRYTYDDVGGRVANIYVYDDPQDCRNVAPAPDDVPFASYTYQEGDVGISTVTTFTDEVGNETTYTYEFDDSDDLDATDQYTLQIDEPGGARSLYSLCFGLLTRQELSILDADEREINIAAPIDYSYTGQPAVSATSCSANALGQTTGLLTQMRMGQANLLQVDYIATAWTTNTGTTFHPDSLLGGIVYPDGSRLLHRYFSDDNNNIIGKSVIDRDGTFYSYRFLRDDDTDALARLSIGELDEENNVVRTEVYGLNPLGLVDSYALLEADNDPYVVGYTYDSLGRLTGVLSGAENINFTLEYPCEDNTCDEVRILDNTLDSVTVVRYDERNRLLERQITEVDGSLLRRSAFAYDHFDRLIREVQWISADANCDDGRSDTELRATDSNCLLITYEYENLTTDMLADEDMLEEMMSVGIGGYQVTKVDPYHRTEIFRYDASDQLIYHQDVQGQETHYIYEADNQNPRRIREVRDDGTETIYNFDSAWQLRNIERGDLRWTLTAGSVASTLAPRDLRFLEVNQSASQTIAWTRNLPNINSSSPDQPEFVTSLQQPPRTYQQFQNAQSQPNAELTTLYDRGFTPTELQTADDRFTYMQHCPAADGEQRILYRQSDGEEDPVNCDDEERADMVVRMDALGRVLEVRERDGATRTFTYSSSEGLWRVIVVGVDEDVENTHTLTYNAMGELISWTNDQGIERLYTYDMAGRLIRMSIPSATDDLQLTFTYDALGNLTSIQNDVVQDASGNLMFTAGDFDAAVASGGGFNYQYDVHGRLIAVQDKRLGGITTYTYDEAGRLRTITTPGGATTQYLYEGTQDYQITTIIDSEGHHHLFDWNDAERTITYTDPANRSTTFMFDSFGNLRLMEDAGGRIHRWDYDADGDFSRWEPGQSRPVNPVIAYTFNEDGDSVLTDGEDWVFELNRSRTGQLLNMTGVMDNASLTLQYDAFDRATQLITDGITTELNLTITRSTGENALTLETLTGSTRYEFDAIGRLLNQTTTNLDGDSSELQLTYQAPLNSPLELLINRDGTISNYTFEEQVTASRFPNFPNQQVSTNATVLDYGGQQHIYYYTPDGKIAAIEEYRCLDTSAERNDPTSAADCATENLLVESIVYTYNPRGQLTQITYSDGRTKTFVYDGVGNLIVFKDEDGSFYTYTYDDINRPIRVDDSSGFTLLLSYDDFDRVIALCQALSGDPAILEPCDDDNAAFVEGYVYLDNGLVESYQTTNVNVEEQRNTFEYTHDFGRTTEIRSGDALLYTIRYDNPLFALPTTIDESQQFNGMTYEYQYEYAPDGSLRIGAIEGDTSILYQYDAQGRLVVLEADGRILTVDYSVTGEVTIVDGQGDGIRYLLDTEGAVTDIVQIRGDEIIESIEATSIRFLPSPLLGDGNIILSLTGGENSTELFTNSDHDLSSIFYLSRDVALDWGAEDGGTSIVEHIGLPEASSLNPNGNSELLVTWHFDSANRPVGMVVRDQTDGGLLYQSTYTIDIFNNLQSEQRQYADGSTLTLSYVYDESGTLIGVNVERTGKTDMQVDETVPLDSLIPSENTPDEVTPEDLQELFPDAEPAEGSSTILALMLILLLISRRYRIGLVVMVIIFAGIPFAVQAQQSEDEIATDITIVRDTQTGHIRSIDAQGGTCATYDYDAFGRLTEVSIRGNVINYQYDLQNRLISAGIYQFVYADDSDTVLMAYDTQTGDQLVYPYVDGLPITFEAQANSILPIYSDAQGNTRVIEADAAAVQESVWLFDSLGRTVDIASAPAIDNLCAYLGARLDPELNRIPRFTIGGNLYDPQTNLIFDGGQTYAVELGQYLQSTSPTRLPSRFGQHIDAYNGLTLLYHVYEEQHQVESLGAATIIQDNMPDANSLTLAPILAVLQQTPHHLQTEMVSWTGMPDWLMEQYNPSLPLIALDDGQISWDIRFAPGLNTHGDSTDMPLTYYDPILMPDPVGGMELLLDHYLTQTMPNRLFVSNISYIHWQRPLFTLAEMESPQANGVRRSDQLPSVIFDHYLNRTLLNPNYTTSLSIAESIGALVTDGGFYFSEQVLRNSIPGTPDLPPVDPIAIEQSMFELDPNLWTRMPENQRIPTVFQPELFTNPPDYSNMSQSP